MNYKLLLETEITNGFSKRDLEYLIGLPKNNLSSFLSGNRSLSKKSFLKIERWLLSNNKPDPLSFKINISDKGTNKDEWLKVSNTENNIIIKNIVEVVKPIVNKLEIESVPLPIKKINVFRQRMEGEDILDYAAAKNNYKKNYIPNK